MKEVSTSGFRGKVLEDTSYQGENLKTTGQDLGIEVETKVWGAKGKFVPTEIRWVVERSLRLAQPLSPVEYDLRPDGRKPHRFRSDSLHLHPLLPSPSARNGGKHGLTPANRFLDRLGRHRSLRRSWRLAWVELS